MAFPMQLFLVWEVSEVAYVGVYLASIINGVGGETTLIGINILGQLLTSLRDELRRQKGYTGKTVTKYLTGVKTNTLVRNGKPVS